MKNTFDVIVVGAGPAGYHAAIRCAGHGMSTACIDKALDNAGKPVLGGVCLNWGCIPSKALLDVSHKYLEATTAYQDFGIELDKPRINIKKMMAFKDKVVGQLTGGVRSLLKAAGVEVLHGAAKLHAGNQVAFQAHDGKSQMLTAKQIILAPGSVPINISSVPLFEDIVVDSTGALEFSKVPKNLGIIGAGVIGLELGSLWSRLGAKTVILEALDTFLPMADSRIANSALRSFGSQGLDVRLGARVTGSERKGDAVLLHYSDKDGDHEMKFDKLVVAVGRRPCAEDLLSDDCGVNLDERGFIYVDEFCRTDAYQVYAIGDVVRGPMLAHKGMEEGLMVADRLAGQKPLVNYNAIPNVVYSSPEIAWVGETEDEVKARGEPCKIGSFPFTANGRALAAGCAEGMVKIVSHAETDRVLGVHIFGLQASELIAQAVIALEFGACTEDLGLTIFAHPTLSEAVHEAALSVKGEAIHVMNRSKKSNL